MHKNDYFIWQQLKFLFRAIISVKRLENTEEKAELNRMIFILELCRESDEDLWKQLILLQLEDLRILEGREGNRIRNEMRRKLQYEL